MIVRSSAILRVDFSRRYSPPFFPAVTPRKFFTPVIPALCSRHDFPPCFSRHDFPSFFPAYSVRCLYKSGQRDVSFNPVHLFLLLLSHFPLSFCSRIFLHSSPL